MFIGLIAGGFQSVRAGRWSNDHRPAKFMNVVHTVLFGMFLSSDRAGRFKRPASGFTPCPRATMC